MSADLRRTLAALIALLAITLASVPANASTSLEEAANAPMVVDVLVLRPVGFISLVAGTALFAVTMPLVLVTRPLEIGKPFKHLIVRPGKYLWADPLGGH